MNSSVSNNLDNERLQIRKLDQENNSNSKLVVRSIKVWVFPTVLISTSNISWQKIVYCSRRKLHSVRLDFMFRSLNFDRSLTSWFNKCFYRSIQLWDRKRNCSCATWRLMSFFVEFINEMISAGFDIFLLLRLLFYISLEWHDLMDDSKYIYVEFIKWMVFPCFEMNTR